MRRVRIIAAALVLALIGAAGPALLALHHAEALAVARREARLERLARLVAIRAAGMMNGAREALQALEEEGAADCSAAHVDRMRRATVAVRAVEEVAANRAGRIRCTSWGTAGRGTGATGASGRWQGVGLATGLPSVVAGGRSMLLMRLGSHDLLLDPGALVDVLAEGEASMAVGTADGLLLAAAGPAPPARVWAAREIPRGEEMLAGIAGRTGLVAVVAEPPDALAAELRSTRLLLLPLAAAGSLTILGTVAWLSRRRLSPLGELAAAVQDHAFAVHYQPLVELSSGRCTGAEALVRWRRPNGSLVRPDLFIPLAEESGLIQPITDQVIEQAMRDLAPALAADPSLHVAVNLSAADMQSPRILPVLEEALAGTGVRRGQLWLEATERGFVDPDAARATITRLRALGHRVAVDDFGTGYSSLSQLEGLPLDLLKIDKSFVDTVTAEGAGPVIEHTIAMARDLGLQLVAEGVETEAQATWLRANGVHYGQGWLFAKPMPAREFLVFCRSRQ